MGSNPYEAPQADITGRASSPPGAEDPVAPLSPEMENRATQLLGSKRSRAGGASFAIAGAICVGVMMLLFGLFLGLIIGGALAGAISRAYVRARTPRYIEQVCAELGIPRRAFNPERYLL
jgi:hypothetical protein